MRNILTLVFFFCLFQVNGQYYGKSYRLAMDVPLSYTDVPMDVGVGVSGGYRVRIKKGLGIGVDLSLMRIYGGGEALTSTKDIYFRGTMGSLVTSIDYKIRVLPSERLSFTPAVGFGVIGFDTKGGFSNPDAAANFFKDWGRSYFVPVFNSSGQLIDAELEGKGFGTSINPSLTIAYEIKYAMSLFIKTGYAFTFTDKVDGYFVPAANNDDNDVFQLNSIGISYLITKRRSFRR